MKLSIKHAAIYAGVLLAGLGDALRGRALAVNTEAAPAISPELAVGLPAGLSSTAVAARKAALIAAGTPAIYAEKFAIDAEQAQMFHDLAEKGKAKPARGPAEDLAQAIIDAQEVEASKPVKALSDKVLAEREAAVAEAERAAQALSGAAKTDREAAAQALADAQSTLAEAQSIRDQATADARKAAKAAKDAAK